MESFFPPRYGGASNHVFDGSRGTMSGQAFPDKAPAFFSAARHVIFPHAFFRKCAPGPRVKIDNLFSHDTLAGLNPLRANTPGVVDTTLGNS